MFALQGCSGGYAEPNPWAAAARQAANDAKSSAAWSVADAPGQTGRIDEPASYAACPESSATRESETGVGVIETFTAQAAHSSLWAAAARNAAEEARSITVMATVRRDQHARADHPAYSRSRGAMERQLTCDASVDCGVNPTVSHIDMDQIAFRRQGLDSWKWLQAPGDTACEISTAYGAQRAQGNQMPSTPITLSCNIEGCSNRAESDVDAQTDQSAVSSPRAAWEAEDDGSIDSEASTHDSTTLQGAEMEHLANSDQGAEMEHLASSDQTAHSSLWAAAARNAAMEAKSAAVMIRICADQDHPTEFCVDSSPWLPTLASGPARLDNAGNAENATPWGALAAGVTNDAGRDSSAHSQTPAVIEGPVCADSSLWAASAREAAVHADSMPFFLAASL